MSRPRHPIKELEAILRSLEDQDWRVDRRGGYYVCKCPCPAKHMKTVKLTPNRSRYEINLRRVLRRDTCWRDD